jgi:hypothetical protein
MTTRTFSRLVGMISLREVSGILERLDPGGRQQRQGFVKNSALREGDGDAVHGFFLRDKARILPQCGRCGTHASSDAARVWARGGSPLFEAYHI